MGAQLRFDLHQSYDAQVDALMLILVRRSSNANLSVGGSYGGS